MFCVFKNLTEKLSLLFVLLKLNKLSLWRRIQGCSLPVNMVLCVHRFWQIYGHLYCWLTRFHTVYKHLFSLLALISSYSAYYSHCSKFPTLCLAFTCRKIQDLWFNISIFKLWIQKYSVMGKTHHKHWPKSQHIKM